MLETFNNTNTKNDRNLTKNNQNNLNTVREDTSKANTKIRGALTENYNK